MKTRYIYTLLLLAGLFLLSCGDKEEVAAIAEEPSGLVIDPQQVAVVVGQSMELDIKEGNDAYKVFTLNEEVATATISENKVKIEALASGKTFVVVSDGGSKYSTIGVQAYYDPIVVAPAEATINLPVGHTKRVILKIEQGNGNYEVESSDEDVVSAVVWADSLFVVLTAKQEGTAELTLKDGYGIKTQLPVKVVASENPYDEAERAEIMSQNTLCFFFDNDLKENEKDTWYTPFNRVEDGRNAYGWNYEFFPYYLKIYFAGDKKVGKKENASLDYDTGGITYSPESIDLEIIKNDGENIWVIFSFKEDNKLVYGYFIQPINS